MQGTLVLGGGANHSLRLYKPMSSSLKPVCPVHARNGGVQYFTLYVSDFIQHTSVGSLKFKSIAVNVGGDLGRVLVFDRTKETDHTSSALRMDERV